MSSGPADADITGIDRWRASSLWRSPWPRFIARRVGVMVVALWVVMSATFFLVRIGGQDPVRAIAGTSATAEYVAQRRAQLGLDGPVLEQYVEYLARMVQLDLGTSFVTNESVLSMLLYRAPYTFGLGLAGFLLALVVSLPAGMAVAALTRGNRRRVLEAGFNWTTGFVSAIPGFLAAITLVLMFAVAWKALPPAGHAGAQSWVLPVVSVALAPAAILARLINVETNRVLGEEYIRTARANRLGAPTIYLRHVLPNVATVLMTYGGLTLAGLLGGSLITETVFAWPGLGAALTGAIVGFDYPTTQAIVVVLAAVVLIINAVIDVTLAIIDPRSMVTRT